MELQGFDFVVRYRKGSSNKAADALSRVTSFYIKIENDITRDVIIKAQLEDKELNKLISLLTNQSSDSKLLKSLEYDLSRSFVQSDGLLLRYVGPRGKPWEDESMYWRVWIPDSLTERVIELSHDNLLSGHLGIRKTYKKLEERVYFRYLRKAVSNYVRSCESCQKAKPSKLGTVPATSF